MQPSFLLSRFSSLSVKFNIANRNGEMGGLGRSSSSGAIKSTVTGSGETEFYFTRV
jgi:hypothetical protein